MDARISTEDSAGAAPRQVVASISRAQVILGLFILLLIL